MIHGRLSNLQRSAAECALPVHFSITWCRKCPEFGWRGRAQAHVLGLPTASFSGAQTFAPQPRTHLSSSLPQPVPGPASSSSTTLSRAWPRLQEHWSPEFGEGGTQEVVFPQCFQVMVMHSKA